MQRKSTFPGACCFLPSLASGRRRVGWSRMSGSKITSTGAASCKMSMHQALSWFYLFIKGNPNIVCDHLSRFLKENQSSCFPVLPRCRSKTGDPDMINNQTTLSRCQYFNTLRGKKKFYLEKANIGPQGKKNDKSLLHCQKAFCLCNTNCF